MHINFISKVEEVVAFIAKMNKSVTQHVGYCGGNQEEILFAVLYSRLNNSKAPP
jgi:hypothetical protein